MRSYNLKSFVIGLAGALAFTACGPHWAFYLESGIEALAKVPAWREEMQSRVADPSAVIEIAYDAESAERAWAENVPAEFASGRPPDYGLYRTMDKVDFETQAVVVWSSGESSGCPGWLADIRWSGEALEVERESYSRSGVCTLDYRPYRMIMAIDRDKLPPGEALPTDQVIGVPRGLVLHYGELD